MTHPALTALSALLLVLAMACASCAQEDARDEPQDETTQQASTNQVLAHQDQSLQDQAQPPTPQPTTAPDQDNPDQAAPLLDLAARSTPTQDQEQTWRADLAVDPDGVLRFTIYMDTAAYACTADRYWMLGGPERTPPHFELSFRLCSCDPEPPPELMDALRPDPVLWLDLRPVDKPIATLYLFRLRPPPLTEVRHLDIEGLDRFIDEHPWEDSRKPCSTSNM